MPEILPSPLQQVERTWVLDSSGRKLIYFAGCDYFRLSSDPCVLRALRRAVTCYGLSVAASRTTTGNHEIYEMLENELAQFFAAESAVLAPNGYSTNLAVAQQLQGQIAAALIDEQAHNSLWDAARFLNCPVLPFKHINPTDLARVVSRTKRIARILLLTDGMFPQTGALAPLKAYLNVLPRTGLILLDDAHAAGLHGKTGKGTLEVEGVSRAQIIQTITLSKAFGTYGGAVLGPRRFTDLIKRRGRIFGGSTPAPLPFAAAARESLRILQRDPSIRQRLFANVALLTVRLAAAGFDQPDCPSPIFALQPRRTADAILAQQRFRAAGIYPPYVRYGSRRRLGYFRFVISSEHTREQLRLLGDALFDLRTRLFPLA